MHTIETHWADATKNRQVSLAVKFTRTENAVQITSVTPKQVTFLCPESNSPLRTVGVWTDKGRELLAKQLHAAGALPQLEKEIEASLAV